MTDVERCSPEAAYLTKPNIVHPGSATQVAALEVQARAELSTRVGVNGSSVTGGSIKR
jgi:hypothetical protein